LAAAHILWSEGHVSTGTAITFASKSGELIATPITNDRIELDFPNEGLPKNVTSILDPADLGKDRVASEPDTVSLICHGLNLEASQLLEVCRNRMDILVQISPADFAALEVDMGALTKLRDNRVISVTTRGGDGDSFDFQSRSFAPACGVPEVRCRAIVSSPWHSTPHHHPWTPSIMFNSVRRTGLMPQPQHHPVACAVLTLPLNVLLGPCLRECPLLPGPFLGQKA
jgi:hypothetical protein